METKYPVHFGSNLYKQKLLKHTNSSQTGATNLLLDLCWQRIILQFATTRPTLKSIIDLLKNKLKAGWRSVVCVLCLPDSHVNLFSRALTSRLFGHSNHLIANVCNYWCTN